VSSVVTGRMTFRIQTQILHKFLAKVRFPKVVELAPPDMYFRNAHIPELEVQLLTGIRNILNEVYTAVVPGSVVKSIMNKKKKKSS
jgi:hypothetical protein